MLLILSGLASASALFVGTLGGPVPRDPTTHKPSPAQCAAARAEERTLPGCDDDERPSSGAEVNSAGDADEPPAPRNRFIICPGDPRCPR